MHRLEKQRRRDEVNPLPAQDFDPPDQPSNLPHVVGLKLDQHCSTEPVPKKLRGLNISLWIVQILFAVTYGATGVMKSTQPIEALTAMMLCPGDVPPGLVRFIGVAELAGAIKLTTLDRQSHEAFARSPPRLVRPRRLIPWRDENQANEGGRGAATRSRPADPPPVECAQSAPA